MSNKNHPATLAQLTEVFPDKGECMCTGVKSKTSVQMCSGPLFPSSSKVAAAQLEKVVSGRGV